MLLKTFKSTRTLNLRKVIELRELHINHGDTMINDAPAPIKNGVMAKIRELSDPSGPKHRGHGSTINLCPWHHKSHMPLAHQKSGVPGTTNVMCPWYIESPMPLAP